MRDFFKTELERLHLTCGLQQYAKLSDSEFTELLDLLCAKCAQFTLIPDSDKQKFIRQCMETDSEFLGFNAKILHKWLNVLNRGYIHTQAEFQESQAAVPPYGEYVKMCEVMGITPSSEQDYDKPVRTENIQKYIAETKASLDNGQTTAAQAAANRAAWIEEQRQKFGVSPEKRAEIQEERYRRLWEKECFTNGEPNDAYLDFDTWKELRFENTTPRELSQGKSQFTEAALTPKGGAPTEKVK